MTEIGASKEELKRVLGEIERGLEQVGRELKQIRQHAHRQAKHIEALETDLRRAGLMRK